jgi:hypothetical protein
MPAPGIEIELAMRHRAAQGAIDPEFPHRHPGPAGSAVMGEEV